ncbi:MAG: 4'-phosphopantetheinyl transferase superfamily protein [Bacteroidota bacterium]
MIYVYYSYNEIQLSKEDFSNLLKGVPAGFIDKILRFRRWQDRQASLMGKLLLRKALLDHFGSDLLLGEMKLDNYQRPFIPFEGDFNISHTAGMVVCAFSLYDRIGIDVEKHKQVEIHEFRSVFTDEEWEILLKEENPQQMFFTLWTKKEAIMKADGRGFYLNPASFRGIGDQISVDGTLWEMAKLDLDDKFTAHLAAPQVQKTQLVQQIF